MKAIGVIDEEFWRQLHITLQHHIFSMDKYPTSMEFASKITLGDLFQGAPCFESMLAS